MMKCKTFDTGEDIDREINNWLSLLGDSWEVSHVAGNHYRFIVFVRLKNG